jgi:hypothetical protein
VPSPVWPCAHDRASLFTNILLGLCTSPHSRAATMTPSRRWGHACAHAHGMTLSRSLVVLTLPRTTQVTTLRLHLYLLDHTPCNLGGSHSPHPFSDVRIDCGRGRREFVRAVAVVNVIGIFQTRRRQWNGGARPSGGGARRGWWRQWAGLPECVAAEIADHPPRRSERLPKRR